MSHHFIIMILIIKLQPGLEHNPTDRPSTAVSYIELQSTQLKPEIVGYGIVKPDLGLQAKAEVTGRVIYINPKLKKGEIFKKKCQFINHLRLKGDIRHKLMLAYIKSVDRCQITFTHNVKKYLLLGQQRET